MFLSVVDRHIFRQWLVVFLIAMFLIVGLLVLGDVFDNLKDLMDFGASEREMFSYYLTLIPSLLPAVLPIAFMVSILFSLGQMHRNNEIIALKAMGLSIWRITRMIWFVGGLLSVLLFYLNAEWVPWSVEKSRRIWDDLAFSSQLETHQDENQVGLVHNLTYYNHDQNRLWFMNRFSEYSFRAFGITVSELDGKHREKVRFVANEGYYDDIEERWHFIDGREILFDPETGDPMRAKPFKAMEMIRFSESPKLMEYRQKDPKDLSFFEIQSVIDSLSRGGDSGVNLFEVRYYSILTNPLICLIVVGLSIPFAISGVRVNPMVGVSKSIGLFFLFYIINSLSQLLGNKELLAPYTAALLPTVVAILLSLVLYKKSF
jgi:lipopolysaccharide export system permease protein